MTISKHGELFAVKDTEKGTQVKPKTKERGVNPPHKCFDETWAQTEMCEIELNQVNVEVFNLIKDFVILEDDLNHKIKSGNVDSVRKMYLDLFIQRFKHAYQHFKNMAQIKTLME